MKNKQSKSCVIRRLKDNEVLLSFNDNVLIAAYVLSGHKLLEIKPSKKKNGRDIYKVIVLDDLTELINII